MDEIIKRILREAHSPDLLDVLVEGMPASDLASLMLEVYRRRSRALTPRHVLDRFAKDRFVKSARIPPQALLAFDSLAFSLLPEGTEALELAPVCPMGTVSVLGETDQNRVLTTVRNTEVCADPTNVLALESALRRRALLAADSRSSGRVRLGTSCRVLRAQVFSGKASWPHFRLLCLSTAGRDEGSQTFEAQSVAEHIGYYLRLLVESRRIGLNAAAPRIVLSTLDDGTAAFWRAWAHDTLPAVTAGVAATFDEGDGGGYYRDLRFQIYGTNGAGQEVNLVDGGFTDWTRKLLSNRKERYLSSAIGTERLLACFGETNPAG